MSAIFTGQFTESGIWYTDSGHRGSLESNILICVQDDDLHFRYEDGSSHRSPGAAAGLGRFPLTGTGVSGHCYLGTQTLLLDYSADVNGRVEHNLDVWTFTDQGITRSGLIRQPERTIWFEAVMNRQPDPG